MQIGAHHPSLVIFFIEVMEQNIAQGNYTFYFPSGTHRQVSEAVTFHQSHAGFKVIAGRDRQRVSGHDLTDWSVGSILPRNHDAAHQIALGENAHQLPILQHWNGADVVLHHESGNFKSRLPHLGEDSNLISEQIRDQHLHLLGTRRRPSGSSSTATIRRRKPKMIYIRPAAEYMSEMAVWKAKNASRKQPMAGSFQIG